MPENKPIAQAVTDYYESATCVGCDKPNKECVVVLFADHAGPYCAKCLMREAKKRRKPRLAGEHRLFDSTPEADGLPARA